MATTSTSDSTPWTSRRVRERRVAAGGAWLTITIIPSNAQFEHRRRPDGSVEIGRVVWPRHWCGSGDGECTGPPAASAVADVGTLGVLPGHTAKRDRLSVGHEVAGSHGQDDIPDGVQDQLRLLVLDVVAALGDHMPAARDQLGQLALQLEPQLLCLLDKRPGHIRM